MNRRMSIAVRTKTGRTYSFTFVGDPKYIHEWLAEGLDVEEVLNDIPIWAANLGLMRVWFKAQDAWRFLRLW